MFIFSLIIDIEIKMYNFLDYFLIIIYTYTYFNNFYIFIFIIKKKHYIFYLSEIWLKSNPYKKNYEFTGKVWLVLLNIIKLVITSSTITI